MQRLESTLHGDRYFRLLIRGTLSKEISSEVTVRAQRCVAGEGKVVVK